MISFAKETKEQNAREKSGGYLGIPSPIASTKKKKNHTVGIEEAIKTDKKDTGQKRRLEGDVLVNGSAIINSQKLRLPWSECSAPLSSPTIANRFNGEKELPTHDP